MGECIKKDDIYICSVRLKKNNRIINLELNTAGYGFSFTGSDIERFNMLKSGERWINGKLNNPKKLVENVELVDFFITSAVGNKYMALAKISRKGTIHDVYLIITDLGKKIKIEPHAASALLLL